MAAANIEKDWAEVLNEHMKTRRAEEIPLGWMSAMQVSKMWNFSKSHANRVLTELVKLKKAERRTFAVAKVLKSSGARGPRAPELFETLATANVRLSAFFNFTNSVSTRLA